MDIDDQYRDSFTRQVQREIFKKKVRAVSIIGFLCLTCLLFGIIIGLTIK